MCVLPTLTPERPDFVVVFQLQPQVRRALLFPTVPWVEPDLHAGGPSASCRVPRAQIGRQHLLKRGWTTMELPPDCPQVPLPKDSRKSRITNGSALLPGVDGRSPWVRRCKDVIAAHLTDLGGEGNTSAAERSLIRVPPCSPPSWRGWKSGSPWLVKLVLMRSICTHGSAATSGGYWRRWAYSGGRVLCPRPIRSHTHARLRNEHPAGAR